MSPRVFAGLGPFRDDLLEGRIGSGSELAASATDAGLDGLEINPFGLDVARAAGLSIELSDLRGIGVSLHSNFLDFNLASPNRYVRRAAVDQLRDELALAACHGIGVLTFHPGRVRKVDRSTAMELFWQALSEVADHGYPVQLCLENMDDKDDKLCNRDEEIAATLSRFPSLRLTVDLAHLGLRKADIGAFLDRFEHVVSHVHVSGVIPGTPHSAVSLLDSSIDLRPHIQRLANRDLVFVIENGSRHAMDESLTVVKDLIR